MDRTKKVVVQDYNPLWPDRFRQIRQKLQRHILFRNFLQENPDYRDRYARVKREAARKFSCDIDVYMEFKSSIIREILEMVSK